MDQAKTEQALEVAYGQIRQLQSDLQYERQHHTDLETRLRRELDTARRWNEAMIRRLQEENERLTKELEAAKAWALAATKGPKQRRRIVG